MLGICSASGVGKPNIIATRSQSECQVGGELGDTVSDLANFIFVVNTIGQQFATL